MEKRFLHAYEKYSDDLFRFAYFKLRHNREEALDFVQNTFIKAWEYIADGKEIKNLRALLYQILRNSIIDYYRSSKSDNKKNLDILAEKGIQFENQEYSKIMVRVEYKEILSIMEKLDDDEKDLIMMRYVDGLGPKEIAQILNETQNVISVRLTRVKKRLKRLLKV